MFRAMWTAALLGAVAGCGQPNAYQPPPPPAVTVAKPLRQTVTSYLEETGTTEPVELVEVRARVRGYLEEISFEAGSEVAAGQLLYRIQSAEYAAKLAAAKADVEAKRVELERANIELARQERLAAQNATAGAQVDEAKAARDGAIADLDAAQASEQLAQLDLDYTEIHTPIAGRVDRSLVKAGNLVGGLDATRLTSVVSYDPIYVNFNINERALLQLMEASPRDEQGRIAEKEIPLQLKRANDADFRFKGRVESADLGVDQTTGTFRIRGEFPNRERRILPGLFVRVRIPVGEIEDAVLIPESATAADQVGRFVLIVGDEQTVERRDVEIGPRFGDYVVATTGLDGDESVIVNGLQRARPGAKVDPETTELKPPSEALTSVETGGAAPPPAPEALEPEAPAAEAAVKEPSGSPSADEP